MDDVDERYQRYITVAKASRCSFMQKNLSKAFYIGAGLLVVGFLVGIALGATLNKIRAGIPRTVHRRSDGDIGTPCL